MVELDRVLYEEVVAHALAGFPNEACGLLAGKEGRAVRFFPMRNADASPATYRLDPMEQLRVFEELEREGWDLFGIVHSHTHSEPYPSETDRAQAFYPEALYLILGLADRERPELRAFRIVDGRVTEEELRIG
jgi:proteasome lid subunit RPN8/RPN11